MSTVPSGYVALDFVGFTDKGTYSATETYMQNDLVHKDNNVWRCLVDNIVNITPVEGGTWTIFIKAPAGIDVATDGTTGTVMGNPDEIIIGTDGMMSISSSFTEQSALAEIVGTETKKTLFGKIAYAITTLISHIADTTIHSNTKNTAGSTDSSSKLFLIGAKSQGTNPQTYSHDTAYVGTDGCLYSKSTKVSVEGHTHESTDITFADDNDAETKLGSINGITDSLTATSSNVALSAAGGNNLQTQIDEVNSNLDSEWTYAYQSDGYYVKYKQNGKTVHVQTYILATISTAYGWNTLCDGLPAAKEQSFSQIFDMDNSKTVLGYVNTSGTLSVNPNGSTGDITYVNSFVYEAA